MSWARPLATLGFITALGVSAETCAQAMPAGVVNRVDGTVSVERAGLTRPLITTDAARHTLALDRGMMSYSVSGEPHVICTPNTAVIPEPSALIATTVYIHVEDRVGRSDRPTTRHRCAHWVGGCL